jgi:hypothetical protein
MARRKVGASDEVLARMYSEGRAERRNDSPLTHSGRLSKWRNIVLRIDLK